VGEGQVSTRQTSLVLGTSQYAGLVRTVDIRTVALPEGSLSAESVDDKIIVSTLKNIGLNITVLLNEYLHTLQIGVIVEIRAWEQCDLNLISEYRLSNEKMFTENT